MPTLNADEKQRRIAEDDGDPSDEVVPARNGGGATNCYHEDPECPHVAMTEMDPEDTETREWCHDNDVVPCRRCVLQDYDNGGRQGLIQQLEDDDVNDPADIDWEAV